MYVAWPINRFITRCIYLVLPVLIYLPDNFTKKKVPFLFYYLFIFVIYIYFFVFTIHSRLIDFYYH